MATSLNNLASLYKTQGDYARAEPLLQRALAIALGSREPELLYHVQGNLSHLLAQQGQPDAELRSLVDQAHRQFMATLETIKTAFAQLDFKRREELALKRLDVDHRGLVWELHDRGHAVVLVLYVVLEEGLRILLTTPEVQLARSVELPAAELNGEIQALREALQSPRRDPLPAAQALYQHLIAPIAEDLEQARARILMVYLDGALRYIPLAVLHDGQQYFAERHALSIFTAAARDRLKDTPQPEWYLAGRG